MNILPIIVEPNLPLAYVSEDPTIYCGHLDISPGLYVISLRTLLANKDKVLASLSNGSTIGVEKTDECVVTQWHVLQQMELQSWFNSGRLRWITGGDAEHSIKNLNNEHFLQATIGSQENLQYKHRSQTTKRPYKFLFTNRKMRPHRKYLVSKLLFHKLLDQALWSCLENYDTWGHTTFNKIYVDHVKLPIRTLPDQYEQTPAPDWMDGVIYPRQFDDTYFSLVSETVFEYPYSFRTEKVYKPILAGHAFLICANQGFYKDLRNLGFRTFGSLIDETFDTIIDGKSRLDRLIQEVSWLCNQDLDKFWQESRDVCLYNQQHAFELHTSQHKTFTKKFIEFMHAT